MYKMIPTSSFGLVLFFNENKILDFLENGFIGKLMGLCLLVCPITWM